MNKKKYFSRYKIILFSIITIFLVVGSLELTSYFIISSFSETGVFKSRQINNIFHPFRGWKAPSNARIKTSKPFFNFSEEVFVETDNDGWVITPFQYENPDIKIVVVGGSTVFGVGSSSNVTTVPSQLAKHIFDKFGVKAKVTNLGVRGYNSFQELMTLHEYLLEETADVVIALSGVNDAKHAFDNDDIRYSLIRRDVFDASVPLVQRAQRQQPIIIHPEGYLREISYFVDLVFRALYRVIGQPEYYKTLDLDNNKPDISRVRTH